MSKDIIKKIDLKMLALLQSLLMEFVMTSEQRQLLEARLKTEKSPFWDETSSWNKAFVKGVIAATGRIHTILDAIAGKKTEYHRGGLTVGELFKLAIAIGINSEEAETNKTLLWAQIKRRLSPNLSRAETQAILYALLKTLSGDEIRWLVKHRKVGWENYHPKSLEWIKAQATALTDCAIRIEDILSAMANEEGFDHYRARVSRNGILALENRLGISPPSAKNLPKRVIKARMLLEIANKNKK